MKLRRRVRSTIAMGAALAMFASGAAIADELTNDGDTVTSDVQSTLALGDVCKDGTAARSVDHWVKRTTNGNPNIFRSSSSVALSVGTVSPRLSVSAPTSSILLPSNWATSPVETTISASVSSSVTFAAGATLGAYSGTVTFIASGVNVNGNSMTRSQDLTVTANVVSCAVATSTSAVNANATFGDSAVTMTATVAPSTVNAGTVTFTVKDGATTVGTVTSGTVTAGSATANFPLSSVGAGSYTIDAGYSGASGFNPSTNSSQTPRPTLTVQRAATTTAVMCDAGPLTFDGTAQTPCSATVTGPGLSESALVSYSDNVNAGDVTASANYVGGLNHLGSSGGSIFTIGKTASSTVVTCTAGPFSYTGSAQEPCSAAVTGAGGLDESLTLTYEDNADAGTATASATYDESRNHQGSRASTTFVIGAADTTTTITCDPGPFTFDGAAKTPCTATVAGPNLGDSVEVEYRDNVDAGTATAMATYAGSTNHAGSFASTAFTIGKAASTTAVTCPTSVTYDGDAQEPCTAVATGAGGLNTPLVVSYENNTDAGTATASASYAESANHTASSGSESFVIDKAPTVTVVSCDAGPFTYTASPQTPCSATTTGAGGLSVAATVVYGNNANAGTATADAGYTESANHLSSVADQVTFVIGKAASTTTVTCPTSVTYDGEAQEPCTAEVAGADLDERLEVRYQNNTDAGTATASADHAESANHLASSDTATFAIDRAASTTVVTCPGGPFTETGSAIEPCSARVTGPGGLDERLTVTYANNVRVGTASATASYAGGTNHLASSGSTTFAIRYSSTGILQPINPDGSSVFKINSTIPVKVKLTGASAGNSGGIFAVSLTRLGATVEGDVSEAVTSTSAHSGTTMRYDATSDQYIFNLGTKGLRAGTYRVTVRLDDGTTRTATFGLR